jgi:hypothetical protein
MSHSSPLISSVAGALTEAIVNSITGAAGAAGSIYAVLGFEPEFVSDFTNEYYKTASGVQSTFSDAITHTRSGNATMTDSDGYIKFAPHNLALNSASPATQSITVVSGADYTVECTGVSIALSGAGTGTVTEGNPVEITASTTTLTLTVTGSEGTMSAYRSDLGGMVDNPERGDSYVPTTSSAKYLPRIGHHIYGGSSYVNRGLFVESEARTNINPRYIVGTGYSNPGTTLTTDNATSPEGVSNATRVNETTGAGSHIFYSPNVNFSAGNDYTLSIYVKPDTATVLQIKGVNNAFGTNAFFANFDLGNEVVGTTSAAVIATTLENVGNGWYRISATAPCTANVTGTIGAIFCFTNNNASASVQPSYTGSASQQLYVHGVQVEQGSTPSSLIPTLGSSDTRPVETFTIPSANLPWNSTAVSIAMDGRVTYADDNSFSEITVWGDDTTGTDGIQHYLDTRSTETGQIVFRQEANNVVDDVASSGTQYSPGYFVPFNISARHGSTFINGAVDGTALTENTTPTALPDLSAESLAFTKDYMGTVNTFRIWNEDITNAGIAKATE